MSSMWRALLIGAAFASMSACGRAPEAREYQLQGQILAIDGERQQVLIKHGDIKGFMPGMTMPFKVRDPALLSGKQPGDLVDATLVVAEVEAHLSSLTTTGHAPLDLPAAPVPPPDVVVPGDAVPDAALVDQEGRPRPLSSLRGHRVALTFMYTRCPLPDFCPLMDRHFAAVQRQIEALPHLADVRLVTVTVDPDFDTSAVLKSHAEKLGADPSRWYLVTGEPAEIDRFASRLGMHVERNEQDAIDITHNLRTAVIDPEGRLVTVHSGNTWTPAQLVADLAATPAPAR